MERKMMIRISEAQHKTVRVKAAELGRPVSEIVRELLVLWTEDKVELSSKSEGKDTVKQV